jgi:hypothetical protein
MTIWRNRFLGWLSLILLLAVFFAEASPVLAQQPVPATATKPIPMLAYYYIWYDTSSWKRAKMDYPLLGKYSSDDISVMLQQILWAKAAGIDGFIVSWKSTDVLNNRLEQLVQAAEQENFKLAVIYEGLDFSRKPLPVQTVGSDLDYFIQHFAGQSAFDIFSKPMVIWSGTWMFTPQEVAQVTQARRSSLLILASERNVAGYLQLAGFVDGNAYYWSSVNPNTFPGYQDKLSQMAQAVHQNGGIWIPPAAPGFDATAIGGTTIVARSNGATFRTQLNTAMSSSPDALGIISWNEFSENSYIEPSQNSGFTYVNILSGINHLPLVSVAQFDSSEPASTFLDLLPYSRVIALGGLSILVVACMVIVVVRWHQIS